MLHAKTEIMEDGTLNGAMSQEEADRIVTLIPNCKYLKVDSLHVIHIDKSLMYIQILKDFLMAIMHANRFPRQPFLLLKNHKKLTRIMIKTDG